MGQLRSWLHSQMHSQNRFEDSQRMLKAAKFLKGKDNEEELLDEVKKFLDKVRLSYHLTRFCA